MVAQAGFCWGNSGQDFGALGGNSPGFWCVLFQVPLGPSLLLEDSTSEEWGLAGCLNRKGTAPEGDGNSGPEIYEVSSGPQMAQRSWYCH